MSGYPGYPPGGGGYSQQQPGSSQPNPDYYQASNGYWYPRASAQTAQPGRSTQDTRRRAESGSSSDEGPNWRFFISGDGISREVIQADIQRYLGNEAVCKPAKNEQGARGYAISAYRNFTAAQIEDLRADSKAWEKEKTRNPKKARTYERSMIHRERQHYGATDQRPAPDVPAPQLAESPQYTHASPGLPAQQRQEGGYNYDANNPASAPRSAQPTYPPYAQPGNYNQSQSQQQLAPQQPMQQQPSQQPPTHPPAPAGYYLASDGNFYRIPT